MPTKQCTQCHCEKRVTAFYMRKNRNGRRAPSAECRQCRSLRAQRERLNNRVPRDNGNADVTRRTITYEYDFARCILGYTHQKATQWLIEKYPAEFNPLSLAKWGLTPERTTMWQPDPVA